MRLSRLGLGTCHQKVVCLNPVFSEIQAVPRLQKISSISLSKIEFLGQKNTNTGHVNNIYNIVIINIRTYRAVLYRKPTNH